jgi:dephospho-CoA kinase
MAVRKVIAVVGMPGAGKAVVSRVAQARAIPVLVCGDVVREEAERRGLPPTPQNLGSLMLQIRRDEGDGVIAERLAPKIVSSTCEVVIVEGVRSNAEVESLKRIHAVTIVAVHASPRTRYERLRARGRSDDPKSWEEFVDRDTRELGVGIGNVIALADKMLVNESSMEEFTGICDQVVSKVIQT